MVSISKLNKWIINLCTVFLFSSFYLFESYSWGRYVLAAISAVVFLLLIIENKGKIFIPIGKWHMYLLALCLYSLVSAIWSINYQDAVNKAIFYIEVSICFTPFIIYYSNGDKISEALAAIKWTGYLVSIYSFIFYGVDFIRQSLLSSTRLENGYSNVNSIGQIAAIAIIIQMYEILNKKRLSLEFLFVAPSLFLILATQSRKAFVTLILGLIMAYWLTILKNKIAIEKTLRIILFSLFIVVAFYFLAKLPIFDGINVRMKDLFDSLSREESGRSTSIRKNMLLIGWRTFLSSPIFGIGFGSPHIISRNFIGEDAYLHNNYIELLCGGGILAFILYYSIYVFFFKHLIINKDSSHYGKDICIILLILFLILDWGKVSCYSKETFFYFLIFSLEIKQLESERSTYEVNV